jgi:hypothetical protein
MHRIYQERVVMESKTVRDRYAALQNVRRNATVFALLFFFALAASMGSFAQASETSSTGKPPYDAKHMALIEKLFRLNEAGLYDQSVRLFADDATLAFWAEGVNGRHWQERHATGQAAIRPYLEGRCFHRNQDKPDGPMYEIVEAAQIDDTLVFRLRPDRKSPDGRYYDPFTVRVSFIGESIRSISISEFISWM